MKKRHVLFAIVIAVLLLMVSLASLLTFWTDERKAGGKTTREFPIDYMAISTPEQLAMIGNDPNYPLDGNYYLTNNIVFGDKDLNGGVDIGISAVVSGTSLTITLTPSGTTVDALFAWIGVANGNGTSDTLTLPSVPIGTYALTIGGELSSGDLFAYSTHIDTSTNGEKTAGVTFNSNGNFDPIGTADDPFTGKFDGNGHIVSGLVAAVFGMLTGEDISAGLFAVTEGAEISNVGVVDGSSTAAQAASGAEISRAGGVVGRVRLETSVINCYNTGPVASVSALNDGWPYAGGVTGSTGSLPECKVINCYNTGWVTAASAEHNARAGGVISLSASSVSTIVDNCYNTGRVESYTSTSRTLTAVSGGVTSTFSGGTITNCYNTGDIKAETVSSVAYAGGVGGSPGAGSISECFNTGNVTAISVSGGVRAGGVTGNSAGPVNCYNTGNVSVSSVSGPAYAGGVTGTAAQPITNCYNTGNVSAATSTAGLAYAGGVAANGGASADISGCSNTGSVSATAPLDSRAGGIVGSTSASVTDSYNRGDVSAGTTAASGTRNARAGGIAGYGAASISFVNTYNTGNVSTSAVGGNQYAGGILGNAANATVLIINSYFPQGIVASNVICALGGPTVDGGSLGASTPTRKDGTGAPGEPDQRSNTAKAVADMKPALSAAAAGNTIYYVGTTGTVIGWDFDTIWTIDPAINDGYPILRPHHLSIAGVSDPEDRNAVVGESVIFIVNASSAESISGTPANMLHQYQWYEIVGGSKVLIPGATGSALSVNNVTLADDGRQFMVEVRPAGHYNGDPVYVIESGVATLNVFSKITVTSGGGGHVEYMLDGDTSWSIVTGETILVPAGRTATINGVPHANNIFAWDEEVLNVHMVGANGLLSITPTANTSVNGEFSAEPAGSLYPLYILLIAITALIIALLIGRMIKDMKEDG